MTQKDYYEEFVVLATKASMQLSPFELGKLFRDVTQTLVKISTKQGWYVTKEESDDD